MNIIGLHAGTHPLHKKWFKQVGGLHELKKIPLPGFFDKIFLKGFTQIKSDIPEADVYILSPSALYSAPVLPRESKIVLLQASPAFEGAKIFSKSTWGWKWPIGFAEREVNAYLMKKIVDRYVDGAICVSNLVKQQVEEFASIPIEVVRPYVTEQTSERLLEKEPNLNGNIATFHGANHDRKGIDILVKGWKIFSKENPEMELHIAGNDHQEFSHPNIHNRGFVDSIPEFLAESSLHVHMARFDAFPVSVLEAMQCGIPTLISNQTGTKSVIDPSFVIKAKPTQLASRLEWYYTLDPEQKREYSRKFRDTGKHFSENDGEFKSTFEELLTKT